jgi:hypothetical protein
MSAWLVLSAAGFYQVTPGQPVYAIGSPLFAETRFNLESGKSFAVQAPRASARNIYLQSALLNGCPYRKSYLTHADIMRGGEIVFEMGTAPNPRWGSSAGDIPVSSIEGEQIVPVPSIEAEGETFKRAMSVSIKSGAPRAKIYYTTDGAEPDARSTLYRRPFIVRHSTTVKAVAFDARGARSFTVEARYHQIPHDWTIRLHARYAPQYSAGGDNALIDGLRGGANFRTGAWQGYQGQNFEAVIDLGAERSVSKIGAGFLQDAASWIWLPPQVRFELSRDGVNYREVAVVNAEAGTERDMTVMVKDYAQAFRAQPARFVKVKADNYGVIPAWHPGAGGAAWIFIDEIIVE